MTEQQTLTISEFLLARIAEDEEEAAFLADREAKWAETLAASPGVGAFVVPTRMETSAGQRAECEAKRRIVAEHLPTDHTCVGVNVHERACPTLDALAAVYADHPDFREEWRPSSSWTLAGSGWT